MLTPTVTTDLMKFLTIERERLERGRWARNTELIVKSAVKRIGLDERLYGAHSLRAGFVTAAAESGAGELMIASQTGHRRMYFRRTDLFRANAAKMIGL